MRSAIGRPLAAALLLASCSRHGDADRSTAAAAAAATSGASTSPRVGDVRIQTTANELDLALVGDTISAGLAPRALEKAREATDTAKVRATGLGGSIERLVKSSVQQGLSARVAFPVSAVKDVRYENGRIQFEWNERPTRLFEQTKVNGKPFLESFRPEDAERFVDAVRARIRPAQ
jgi:hypothetical protein